ncbi:aspartate aminotransferase [Chitinophaga terrae (ex Kim and Jung 2007)]|uniref:Aspartate aminotransferase n=1 Tax=Chitinophaga terrae (ex Kim and Jung 2007) TaxID=408074 RepID=A0A1H4G3V7_9BACT|nr:aminotransferase class I/II-fold pyridoxal phosphate-dependent enzyme [Chitinophaga terrae (ex Kim and Jung 2007)]GEP92965.1 aminotransferase [Chitinophaga terrae (ex Kim and Jung 2007)]SEB04259.1 aspartate aminotransferase [Chitinophaga terrae (ex Kim and Jung 2007)]
MKLSHLAETLIGSEIIKLAADIKEKQAKGEKIYNFTIGDFDPKVFPIPEAFEQEIINAYKEHLTNYPPADGILELRQAVGKFIAEREGLTYDPAKEIVISCGGRPIIYATFRTIVDRGEKVVYATPSWNNNHYTHFLEAEHVVLETTPENNFMPTAAELKPLLKGASLLALCSPQNPTGTAFSKQQLEEICDLVLAENKSRGADEKPLYVLFDQMYWVLTFGNTEHYNPVTLRPEMRDYTLFIDGMSKAFAATGVRVGWALGPAPVIAKMKAILSHVGAWSPMAEQKAAARYLVQKENVDAYLKHFKAEVEERLVKFYEGFEALKKEGHKVDAIAPQAAIYLTVKLDLAGKKTADGTVLADQAAVTSYILNEAKLALVPFNAFGAAKNSPWYRLSVGTCVKEEIPAVFAQLRQALSQLV